MLHKFSIRLWSDKQTDHVMKEGSLKPILLKSSLFFLSEFEELIYIQIVFLKAFEFFLNYGSIYAFKKSMYTSAFILTSSGTYHRSTTSPSIIPF